MNRRELLRGAAWSVPVIAAAIATPMTAASEPVESRSRIGFTNLTATVGAGKGTVYVNTKVLVLDGPEPVEGLSVTIVLEQGDQSHRHTFAVASLPGWGSTDILRVQQAGFTVGEPVKVFFTATANGAETITGMVQVETPRWWS